MNEEDIVFSKAAVKGWNCRFQDSKTLKGPRGGGLSLHTGPGRAGICGRLKGRMQSWGDWTGGDQVKQRTRQHQDSMMSPRSGGGNQFIMTSTWRSKSMGTAQGNLWISFLTSCDQITGNLWKQRGFCEQETDAWSGVVYYRGGLAE